MVQIRKADCINGFVFKCDLIDEFWQDDLWSPNVVKVLLPFRVII